MKGDKFSYKFSRTTHSFGQLIKSMQLLDVTVLFTYNDNLMMINDANQ